MKSSADRVRGEPTKPWLFARGVEPRSAMCTNLRML